LLQCNNSVIVEVWYTVTGQFADKPTRGQSSR